MSYEQLKWYGVPDQEARKLFLEEQFEFEVCSECGLDADQHKVGFDLFGNPCPECVWPIDWDLPYAEQILNDRAAVATA